jgi:VanZ family protein
VSEPAGEAAARPTGESAAAPTGSLLRRRAWLVWAAVMLVWAVIPLSWLLGHASSSQRFSLTTAAHFGEYVVLAGLVVLATRPARPWLVGAALAVLTGLLYGPLTEVVQLPLPYRSFQVGDILADWSGTLVGALAFSAVCARGARRRGLRA